MSCKIHKCTAKNGTRPLVCHPERWRSIENDGHKMLSDADNLAEFAFVRLVGRGYSSAYGPFPKKFKLHSKNDIKVSSEFCP